MSITYLNKSDLSIRATETKQAYGDLNTATHAALQGLEHYLRTPNTSIAKTTLIITTSPKLAHIINTNTFSNPALRSKEKYQSILRRISNYATSTDSHLIALLIPLENKHEWHISNTSPDNYTHPLDTIPNATRKIINAVNTTHAKAKKCLETIQPNDTLHDLEWYCLPDAAIHIGPYNPRNIITTDLNRTLRHHYEQKTTIPKAKERVLKPHPVLVTQPPALTSKRSTNQVKDFARALLANHSAKDPIQKDQPPLRSIAWHYARSHKKRELTTTAPPAPNFASPNPFHLLSTDPLPKVPKTQQINSRPSNTPPTTIPPPVAPRPTPTIPPPSATDPKLTEEEWALLHKPTKKALKEKRLEKRRAKAAIRNKAPNCSLCNAPLCTATHEIYECPKIANEREQV